MNRLIGAGACVRRLEQLVPTEANASKNVLGKSTLVLISALAASAFAQESKTPPAPTAPVTPNTKAVAVGPSDPQTKLMTVVEPKYESEPTARIGDDVDPATGTVTFSATDISIPGNFAIPVTLSRWVPSDDADTGGPADWKWNIPFIRGNYLDVRTGHSSSGWNWGGPETWRNGRNCTGSADTVINNAGELIAANAYWQGKLLHIPGITSETFVTNAGGEQVTKSHFKIVDCINPADQQGIVQQGIVVRGPDGTTYTFNQVKNYYNGKAALDDPIVRTRLLMITTIKDRFNNEVNYSYDQAGRLTGISASDGREITITYQNGQAYQASAHGRTWTYGSSGVTLPDGREWRYEGLPALAFNPNGSGGYNQELQRGALPTVVPGCTVAAGDYPVTITSPDGLRTVYKFRDTIHYRSDVEPDLYKDKFRNYTLSRALYCTVKRSVVSKTTSGPGVGPYTWNYTYSGNRGTYQETSIHRSLLTGPFELPMPVGGYPAPIAAGGAEHYRAVTVRGPDKQTIFYIDRRFHSISEERVVAQDILNVAGTELLERSEFSYALGAYVGEHWYLCPCEGMYPPINENQLTHHINQTQVRRIRFINNRADATFTTTYPATDFDERGRPKTIIRAGSVGAPSRTERVVYDKDNATFGVMGQVKRVSIDGISQPMAEHTYDPYTALRTSTKKFGILQATYEYHADGNLWKAVDGLGHATVYTDYRRGQPRRTERADGTFETVEVNDWGLVTDRIDPNGHAWSYRYDDALRLCEIAPPPGWTHTFISYERANAPDFGLPAGHWRKTVDKGNARTVTYFDAMWRPLMVRTYDTSNESGTRTVAVKGFDASGQAVFESYPRRDFSTVATTSPGRRMQFDALGRITRLEADSDKGVLVTRTEYLGGLQMRVTNPRNKITTQRLWAQDDPDGAQLAEITAPEGVRVRITRNVLGNPTSIRRWGTANGVSADVTRSYVYDNGQRLCKTLEPEVIATVQGYDLAGNVAWRAPGVSLSVNRCESEASVPPSKKISYTYDAVNQLKSVTYGDGSPGIVRTYWNDGLLRTIDSNGAVWSYEYDSQRKLTSEALIYGAKEYRIGWNYDANGNLSAVTYPSGGPSITYSPNALGEPRQVGTFAKNISFHPNGAIAGFTFGNNIVHSLTQTVEGTPKLNRDGNVLQDLYTYDANGNVEAIVDQRTNPPDGRFSRTMTYDSLDRLTGVSAPGVWGNATYLYDPVDNLRTAAVGPRVSTLNYSVNTNRLDSLVTNGTGVRYAYDDNGNIRSKGSATYTFDLGNRMTSASSGGSYAYDGHGRRIRILRNDGSTDIQVYSQGGQLLWSERDGVGKFRATVRYECSTGTLMGQQCVTTSTYPATISLSCNAGDSLSRSTCTRIGYVAASVIYSCPTGYTLGNTTCSTTSSTLAAASYSCNGLTSDESGYCRGVEVFAYSDYEARDACAVQGDSYGLPLATVTNVSGRRYACIFRAKTTYSCPNGGALNGTQCIATSSRAATPQYSCRLGTLTGNQCAVSQTYTAMVNYRCNTGDSINGGACTHSIATQATANYSCPGQAGIQCDGSNSISTAYIYLAGKQVAEAVIGGATQYVHTDALGSPVAHTDSLGSELNRTKFEPYGYTAAGAKPGAAAAASTTTGSAIGFTGHVSDPETDLVYMQQRYYDPIAARFLSIDPVVTDVNTGGSFNRYAYANNTPYRYVDPDGRNPLVIEGATLGGEIGAVAGPIGAAVGIVGGGVVALWLGDKAINWIASAVGGNRGSPMDVKDGTNPPTTIGGRDYSGHAQDRMQGRGVPPSAVEEAIKNGTAEASRGGTTVYTDSKNGIRVVVNADGKVVTVIPTKNGKGGGSNNNENRPKKGDKPNEPDPKPPKS